MKRYIKYAVNVCLILALLLCTSCEKETFTVTLQEKNTLTLNLHVGDLKSRAIDDNDDLNENLINTLNIFLYPTGGKPIHEYVSDRSDKETSKVSLEAKTSDLFPNGATECGVYVIANYPGGKIEATDLSIDNLKKLTVTSSTFTDANAETNFVMDSNGTDKIKKTTDELSSTINLYRAAAKVEVFVSVEKIEHDEDKIAWNPLPETLEIEFHNGMNKAYIGNDIEANKYYTPSNSESGVTFKNEAIQFNSTTTTEFIYSDAGANQSGVKYDCYTTNLPYYTYPMKWNNTDNASYPYFIMTIKWEKQNITIDNQGVKTYIDTGEEKDISYAIPVNKDGKCIDRNTCYQLLVSLGVSGVDVQDIEASYILVKSAEWGLANISATMAQNVYMVVDEHNVTINNKDSYIVKFTSSHDVEARIVSITQPNYAKDIASITTFYNQTNGSTQVNQGTNGLYRNCSVAVDNENNTITLNHDIVNKDEVINKDDVDKTEYDIAPYTIRVYVKMVYGINDKNEKLYYEDTIEFIQYPAIYVEAKQNSDYTNTQSSWNTNRNTFVNSYYTKEWSGRTYYDSTTGSDKNVNQSKFGIVPGLCADGPGNTNPNMYVIYATSMSDNNRVIGDPRVTSVYNLDESGWASAPALYPKSTNRQLNYYYPTDNSDETKEVIAPIFRIASSYSVTQGVNSLSLAEKRCASYQEDGYPAGRWRVPTYAEVEFICRLSSEGKIPALFYAGGTVYYWCAHGEFAPDGSNGIKLGDGAETVRCVYDEWYWGSKQITDNSIFTWGDYPRDAWQPSGN